MTTTKRMDVTISKGSSQGMLWIEGDELMEAVKLHGRERGTRFTRALYSTFDGSKIYEVAYDNEAPARKWISRVYQEIK